MADEPGLQPSSAPQLPSSAPAPAAPATTGAAPQASPGNPPGTTAEPAAQTPSSAATSPASTSSAPTSAETLAGTPPTPRNPTDDEIASYLSKRSHDDLKHIPAYNAQVVRSVQREREKLGKAQAEAQNLAQWDQYFRGVEAQGPQALGALMQQRPELAPAYAHIVEVRRRGGPGVAVNPQEVAGQILENMHEHFQTDPEWAGAIGNWDELTKEPDPSKFLSNLVEARLTAERKRLNAESKAEVKAQVDATLAKYHITVDEPDSVPGTISPTGGLTWEQYLAMSPAESKKLPSAEIDRMYAQHVAAAR